MALVTTTPISSIPDFKYEYHTVIVDTINQASKNTFTIHLQQPIENVVQARLCAAQINTGTSNVCHISISELNTNFSQRGTSDLEGESTLTVLNRSFGSLIGDGATAINFKDNYPVVQQYLDPIKRLSRMTFTLRDDRGQTLPGTQDNFFIFRFVCDKPNLPGR